MDYSDLFLTPFTSDALPFIRKEANNGHEEIFPLQPTTMLVRPLAKLSDS